MGSLENTFRSLGVVATLLTAACDATESRVHGSAGDGLVFVRAEDGAGDLFRARLRDGAVQPLWQTPDRDEDWPLWSPVAQRLLFESRESAEVPRTLRLWDPVSNEDRPLDVVEGELQHAAVWSPLGDRVVFAVHSRAAGSGLVAVGVNGGTRVWIDRPPIGVSTFRPSVSPGGMTVVAERSVAGDTRREVWIFEPGSAPRALTQGDSRQDSRPRFLRGGNTVVFTRAQPGSAERRIALISVSGGEERSVTGKPGRERGGRGSPTRDEIVFVSDHAGGVDDLFLLDLAAGVVRNLTRTPDRIEAGAHWSPDGERIVFSSSPPIDALARATGQRMVVNRSEAEVASRIGVVDREGRRLFEARGRSPDWMPPWP